MVWAALTRKNHNTNVANMMLKLSLRFGKINTNIEIELTLNSENRT